MQSPSRMILRQLLAIAVSTAFGLIVFSGMYIHGISGCPRRLPRSSQPRRWEDSCTFRFAPGIVERISLTRFIGLATIMKLFTP
jgi:hypothetical protein